MEGVIRSSRALLNNAGDMATVPTPVSWPLRTWSPGCPVSAAPSLRSPFLSQSGPFFPCRRHPSASMHNLCATSLRGAVVPRSAARCQPDPDFRDTGSVLCRRFSRSGLHSLCSWGATWKRCSVRFRAGTPVYQFSDILYLYGSPWPFTSTVQLRRTVSALFPAKKCKGARIVWKQ